MLTINNRYELHEGDLMFGPIHGLSGAGVALGQLILAIAEPVVAFSNPRKWMKYRHCGVVSQAGTLPTLVQAEPGGAEEVYIDASLWNNEFLYIRPEYYDRQQAGRVAAAARLYIDTPYDFETYGAIPLYRRGLHTKKIKRIISGTDTMMCSRLVDACLDDAGWHLFSDGRLPGNVTPSEVLNRVRQMPITAMSNIK